MPPASLRSVVVCTPSRGLIHSRTVEAVWNALSAATDRLTCAGWLITHDLPIPDAHETLAERGMTETFAAFVWFVEEDVLPPPDALLALLTRHELTGAGIVALDYPVGEAPTRSCVTRNQQGHVLWAGLGCTLIDRATLERLPRPWFRTDRTYLYSPDASREELVMVPQSARYGGHDVAFYLAARAAGVSVEAIDGPCGHARLRALGAAHTNQGAHVIDTLTAIEVRS